jgi:hypothetical protein
MQAKQDFSLPRRRLECALRFVYVTQEGGSATPAAVFKERAALGRESVFYVYTSG